MQFMTIDKRKDLLSYYPHYYFKITVVFINLFEKQILKYMKRHEINENIKVVFTDELKNFQTTSKDEFYVILLNFFKKNKIKENIFYQYKYKQLRKYLLANGFSNSDFPYLLRLFSDESTSNYEFLFFNSVYSKDRTQEIVNGNLDYLYNDIQGIINVLDNRIAGHERYEYFPLDSFKINKKSDGSIIYSSFVTKDPVLQSTLNKQLYKLNLFFIDSDKLLTFLQKNKNNKVLEFEYYEFNDKYVNKFVEHFEDWKDYNNLLSSIIGDHLDFNKSYKLKIHLSF